MSNTQVITEMQQLVTKLNYSSTGMEKLVVDLVGEALAVLNGQFNTLDDAIVECIFAAALSDFVSSLYDGKGRVRGGVRLPGGV